MFVYLWCMFVYLWQMFVYLWYMFVYVWDMFVYLWYIFVYLWYMFVYLWYTLVYLPYTFVYLYYMSACRCFLTMEKHIGVKEHKYFAHLQLGMATRRDNSCFTGIDFTRQGFVLARTVELSEQNSLVVKLLIRSHNLLSLTWN